MQVLVDFYATWCGPCVMMAKELSQLSESMKDQVVIASHPFAGMQVRSLKPKPAGWGIAM
jgi:thiol-disulfide isomerase/thioredoxin